jgi:hypothetical protein
MARFTQKQPFILQDRTLLATLCFGSSGYIIIGSWEGMALLVAAFMTGAAWAYRTAQNHPQRGFRLMATMLLVTLGVFLTVYVSVREGIIR